MLSRVNIFRYPGGKSKVAHTILEHVPSNLELFCEPFCGGASVSLRLAQRDRYVEIRLNDIDPRMAAFWKVVAKGNVDSLCDRILATVPTVELFRKMQLVRVGENRLAFAALFLNRTAYSGKMDTTPVGGWNQDGKWKIDSEWRQEYLVEQVCAAAKLLADRTQVTNWDFREVISNAAIFDGFCYIDPPYFHRGKSMYKHALEPNDHGELSYMLMKYHSMYGTEWLLSYDDCKEIRALYTGCKFVELSVPYSTSIGANYRKTEVLIKP